MQKNCYSREIFYYETDQMGIVHHSNYVRWLEEARLEIMKQAGISYSQMEEAGVLIPVLEVSVSYKTAFRYGERFFITAKLSSYNGIRMRIEYELRKEPDGEVCATGTSGHCFCRKDLRPLSLKKEYPDISEKFESLL